MTLRVVWRLAAIDIMTDLQYRGAFFLYVVAAVLTPVISLLVWLAISSQGVHLPYSHSQLVTYYLLLCIVSVLTSTWLGPFLAEVIRLGDLSAWLLRPAPYITAMIANNIGEKIVKFPFLLGLVGFVALLFHGEMRLPADPVTWLLFLLSLPGAAAIAFLLDFIAGSLAFWVQDVRGLLRIKLLAAGFLAGQFVPLALFPPALHPFLAVQPFRFTISFPIEILMGQVHGSPLLLGFALEAGYCLALWALYRLEWHIGLRSYGASGA